MLRDAEFSLSHFHNVTGPAAKVGSNRKGAMFSDASSVAPECRVIFSRTEAHFGSDRNWTPDKGVEEIRTACLKRGMTKEVFPRSRYYCICRLTIVPGSANRRSIESDLHRR